jgi:mannobiose 2-epimerase
MTAMRTLALLLLVALSLPAQYSSANVQRYAADMDRLLRTNIASFWLTKSLDQANGGYLISFDAQGQPVTPANKGIVTQARQVWLFSQLHRRGYADSRAAARLGFEFLRDKMWDAQHGGFYWETDAQGRPVNPVKHLYGNAFGLYAISEYALAFDDPQARSFVTRIFLTLENQAHDPLYGGYQEAFARDWTPLPKGAPAPLGPAGQKLMNTHLHLMEALTTYYRAVPSPLARERLAELTGIETNAVVRKTAGACTDKYERDWTPILTPETAIASYGHDLENVWLVMDALQTLNQPVHPYLDLFRQLWSYSLKYGYDEANGGFYYLGPLNQPATNREKSWWVQAEVLVSSLRMFELTGDPIYWQVFEKTWTLTRTHLIDEKNGEWYASIRDGKPQGSKGNLWKAGYHNGRALIESIEILRRLRP